MVGGSVESIDESACSPEAPVNPDAGVKIHGQAHESDGSDVLVAEQIISLALKGEPGENLEAASQAEIGVSVVEIAIWQEQGVGIRSVSRVLQIGGVIGAAGEG